MKYILSLIIGGALVVSGFGQTRNVLVGTNNAVVQPTNFWSADASNARTALGLGTAATNAATAFQPSSLALSNLASSNGVNLTNISVSGIVGALATNGNAANLTNFPANLLRTNGSAAGLTNFPANLLTTNGNGSGLTSLNAANINGTVALASNVSGVVAITNGGTGATNAETARTNLGLGWSALTNSNPATALLGYNTTNGQIVAATNVVWTNAFSFSTNTVSALVRSNLGLVGTGLNSTIGGGLSNIASGAFATIGGGYNNTASGGNTTVGGGADNTASGNCATVVGGANNTASGSYSLAAGFYAYATNARSFVWAGNEFPTSFSSTNNDSFNVRAVGGMSLDLGTNGIVFRNTTNASVTRTNLGLGWPALTNSNAGTGLVSVNTNGEVVSPTNFWQQAPIATTVAFSAPATNSTNTATNSRNLIIQSLSSNINNTTNTLLLPTNTSTFNGDTAVVIHAGGSGSATAIRQSGQTSNLIVLTNFDHAVRFLYFNNTWDFYHNLAYVEPIYFSGTNAAALAAASRTNLGLGATNQVVFSNVVAKQIQTDVLAPTWTLDLFNANILYGTNIILSWSDTEFIFANPVEFNNTTNAATTRTNLGLPLAALTNTNNANFQAAVFATNTAPVSAAQFGDRAAWMEITVQTNGSNVSFRIPLYK